MHVGGLQQSFSFVVVVAGTTLPVMLVGTQGTENEPSHRRWEVQGF